MCYVAKEDGILDPFVCTSRQLAMQICSDTLCAARGLKSGLGVCYGKHLTVVLLAFR